MKPYTTPEIYLLLENANCMEDVQRIANHLNEAGVLSQWSELLKVYVNLFV
jgi:hypothetical protein